MPATDGVSAISGTSSSTLLPCCAHARRRAADRFRSCRCRSRRAAAPRETAVSRPGRASRVECGGLLRSSVRPAAVAAPAAAACSNGSRSTRRRESAPGQAVCQPGQRRPRRCPRSKQLRRVEPFRRALNRASASRCFVPSLSVDSSAASRPAISWPCAVSAATLTVRKAAAAPLSGCVSAIKPSRSRPAAPRGRPCASAQRARPAAACRPPATRGCPAGTPAP